MNAIYKNGLIKSKNSAKEGSLPTSVSIPNGSPATINPEIKMSKYLYIIDNGHGGLIEGEHQTAGKRSPKDADGNVVIYEGVNNRINANLLIEEMERVNIRCVKLVDTNYDISLAKRVSDANEIARKDKCIFISIHSNAAGNGLEWANARGISVHIAPNCSAKTSDFSEVIAAELKENFKEMTRWRGIKVDNFYVLRKTNHPAILLEIGFHDNQIDAEKMQSDEWRNALVKSIIDAITIFES